MKKIFMGLLACLIAIPAFAAIPDDLAYNGEYNASGDTDAVVGTYTGDMRATSGRRIEIWSIMAMSDKSDSAITISEGDTTGATANYSVVAEFDCGDKSLLLQGESVPLYVGPINTQLRVNLDSTDTNSLVVGWRYR